MSVQAHSSARDILEASKAWMVSDEVRGAREALMSVQAHSSARDILEASKAWMVSDEMRSAREALMSVQAHSSVRDILGASKAWMESDELRGAREALMSLQAHSSARDILEASKAWMVSDEMRGTREALMAMQSHGLVQDSLQMLNALQMIDPLKAVRKAVEATKLFESADSILYSIKKLSDEAIRYGDEDGVDIYTHSGGQVYLGSDSISQHELQNISNQIINDAFFDNHDSLEGQINKLIELVSSLKEPFHHKLITLLLFPVILVIVSSVLNPIADFYVKKELKNNEKRQIEKELRTNVARMEIDKSYLSAFKMVSASVLNVRKSATKKSPVLGTLYFGNVVEVIEKHRSWTLISWRDSESGTAIQGWVYSRYLKRLN
ncbi:ABC-type tungstate transport system substrate-binding protein [Cellvibrio fibrivorans]|uniref:ABC-type tungstate transport system substrate-binding protein n=2 Tax=Cellvibrio fibrivorans TaxID=126350 RepID=A0ABU1V2S2_9GAMM|nr:ABC-type tungstate transport system substrate-binding protein [Cellvibrio fibrivorans]